jgi:AcrR family transcriptional regulator
VADSGSSTGSFYFYFRNKEDLFAAVLKSVGERISAALNEAIANVADPFLQMRAAVERLFSFLTENPDEARILIVESSGLSPRLHRIRRNIISSHCRSVEKALQRMSGALPTINPEVVARCWVGGVYESVYQWLETPGDRRMSAETIAQEVAQFNLRGIGAPKEVL